MSFRLLHLDIETSPALTYVWDIYKPHIGVDQIVVPTRVLCFAAKWHSEKEVMFHGSREQTGVAYDAMIEAAHKLLTEADAVCHYNGKSFDIPRLNVEFLRLGLPPTPPIPQIDLKEVIWRRFGFVSSRLAFIGPELKIGKKIQHEGWPLWLGCLDGDPKCWRKMRQYNMQDVKLLPRLYEKLLPWIPNHPNMGLYRGGVCCPNCGSKKIQWRGMRRTLTQAYHRYQCGACGYWGNERKKAFAKESVALR